MLKCLVIRAAHRDDVYSYIHGQMRIGFVCIPGHHGRPLALFLASFGPLNLFLCLNRSYKSHRTASLFLCRMADLSILITAAQWFDVVPNFNTSNHPTPSDPPEQPQAPEQNDGDSDVEEIAPQSPQDATLSRTFVTLITYLHYF